MKQEIELGDRVIRRIPQSLAVFMLGYTWYSIHWLLEVRSWEQYKGVSCNLSIVLNVLVLIVVFTYYKACASDPRICEYDKDDPSVDWTAWSFCSYCDNVGPRPPNSHHCKRCGHCRKSFDHHCTYVRTCITAENYKEFMHLVVSALVAMIYCVSIFIIDGFSLWPQSGATSGVTVWHPSKHLSFWVNLVSFTTTLGFLWFCILMIYLTLVYQTPSYKLQEMIKRDPTFLITNKRAKIPLKTALQKLYYPHRYSYQSIA